MPIINAPLANGYRLEFDSEAQEIREYSPTGLNVGVTYNVATEAEALYIILDTMTVASVDAAARRGDADAEFIAQSVGKVFSDYAKENL